MDDKVVVVIASQPGHLLIQPNFDIRAGEIIQIFAKSGTQPMNVPKQEEADG